MDIQFVEFINWWKQHEFSSDIIPDIYEQEQEQEQEQKHESLGRNTDIVEPEPILKKKKTHPFVNLPDVGKLDATFQYHPLLKDGMILIWRGRGNDAWLNGWVIAMFSKDAKWFRMTELYRSRKEGLRRIVVDMEQVWGTDWWKTHVKDPFIRKTEIQKNLLSSEELWYKYQPPTESNIQRLKTRLNSNHNEIVFDLWDKNVPIEWSILMDWSNISIWIWHTMENRVVIVHGLEKHSCCKPIVHFEYFDESNWGLWCHENEEICIPVETFSNMKDIITEVQTYYAGDYEVHEQEQEPEQEQEQEQLPKKGSLSWFQHWAEIYKIPIKKKSKTGKMVNKTRTELEKELVNFTTS